MKVLMIGQLPKEVGGTYTTGVCNVVYELSKCYNKEINLCVYATNMTDEAAKHLKGNSSYRGSLIRPWRVLLKMMSSPLQTFKEWKVYRRCHGNPLRYEVYRDNIERIIEEEKPDIVHCMNEVQGASTSFSIQTHNIPFVLTFHGVNKINPFDEKELCHHSEYVTGLTPETISDLLDLGYNRDRLFEIPNGTDTSKFYFDTDERHRMRESLGISRGTTVMLTVGSLCHRKGQLSFCKLLKDMPNSFDYKYLILGSGPDDTFLRTYIHENELEDRVLIIGYVANTDLYKYYSAADVYVHASYSEGQALSEVEAYTTDLKIALNRDILGTVVTDTTNADDYYIFDYNNFDHEKFSIWARNIKSKRKTRMNCDWNQIFDRYVELYKYILR